MAAQVTPLPEPPSISDPLNFEEEADAFVGSLVDFVTEVNALSIEVEGHALTAETDAAAAEAAKLAAEAAANVATAVPGASKWLVGTTYSEGNTVWSPINYQTFRRRSTGAPASGGADPSVNETWWAPVGNLVPSFILLGSGVI